MFKAWVEGFDRKILYSLAVMSITVAALLFAASNRRADAQIKGSAVPEGIGTSFPGSGVGSIPDLGSGCQPTQGTPLNVTFSVTGITGAPSAVSVDVTFGSPNHSWAGDVTSTLIAPNGASHTIFSRVLATTSTAAGDNSDLGGLYSFSNTAVAPPSGGFWQAATAQASATSPIATGLYRTTGPGGAGATNPMPATDINAAFAGVANPNGTWTLRFTDGCAADTGAVTAANLTITGATVPADANIDFNGDGNTDFVVARGTNTPFAEGEEAATNAREMVKRPRSDLDFRVPRNTASVETPQAPPIFWYTSLNTSGAVSGAQWGDAATDFITPEDFDGDGRDDIAIWRPGAFYILNSSNGTARVDSFGIDGDDPAVVGDYDGDNKADPAVFRCPGIADPDGQCFFFYRGSLTPANITYAPWGFGVDGDFFPLVGDFDGDGKNDFCIQRSNPSAPSQGQFVLRKSGGGADEYINWGNSSDFLIPGDYDGDGKTDFCVRRSNIPTAGARTFFILTRTGVISQIQWGITGDVSVPGDYDGDGRTDIAIWRGSTDATQNHFWIRNSSNGSTTVREWGQCPTVSTCDFPVAGWAVH